jgi:dTDP-4-dehydrorhamnose reductase
MKIVVTGANGMVARATIAHCRSVGDEVFAFTRQDLDIGERSNVVTQIRNILPDALINCAAYTNVDGAESEPAASERANSVGVENLAAACKQFDARFLTISTDYVFDGKNAGFYTQRDTPNPLGVYGRTKLEGEIRARDTYARSIIVRSGWIYGRGGTNFLSVVYKLLGEGKQISAISDSYGTPTFADDLAARMRELIELDLPGIYHVTNAGDGTSYAGFAEKVCELATIGKDLVKGVSKDELQRPAARPVSSKLACLFSERLGLAPLRKWDEALSAYIDSERPAN